MTIANCRYTPLYTHVAHNALKCDGSWLNLFLTAVVKSNFAGNRVFPFEAPFGLKALKG